LIDYLITLKSN